MIQEITNGTWKMDQAMKRKRIFFTKGTKDKHVEVKGIEDGKNPSDKPVGLNSHADR